jgi:hypothetical protein
MDFFMMFSFCLILIFLPDINDASDKRVTCLEEGGYALAMESLSSEMRDLHMHGYPDEWKESGLISNDVLIEI